MCLVRALFLCPITGCQCGTSHYTSGPADSQLPRPARYVKVALLPNPPAGFFACCTHTVTDLERPTFGELFPFPIQPDRLVSKSLKINVWTSGEEADEICLVSGRLGRVPHLMTSGGGVTVGVLLFHDIISDSFCRRHICNIDECLLVYCAAF